MSRPVLIARNLSCEREVLSQGVISQVKYCGGFSRGVPPLPIPNREVKPVRADGTDTPVGRVGRCRSSGSPIVERQSDSFFCVVSTPAPRLFNLSLPLSSPLPLPLPLPLSLLILYLILLFPCTLQRQFLPFLLPTSSSCALRLRFPRFLSSKVSSRLL